MNIFTTIAASVGQLNIDALPNSTADGNKIQSIVQAFITLLGAIALLVIVLGGVRYILSRGDPQQVAQSKNTIIYALIGLVVVIFAQVIVTFVVKKV